MMTEPGGANLNSKTVDILVSFAGTEPVFEESVTPAEKCVSGRPLQRTWNHFTSADEKFFAGIWEGERGCWRVGYTENEFFEILSGHSVLRDANGAERQLRAGDRVVIPAGFEGEWEVVELTRKVYVIYQP
jgi:hypothetical protein